VDAAAATANRGDDNSGCNEDHSACTSPIAATATPLSSVVGATPRQRNGPPLSRVAAYFILSLDNKDEEEDKDDVFDNGKVCGRSGSGSGTRARQQPKTRCPGFPTPAILTKGTRTTTKRRTMTTAPILKTILPPLPPRFPLPSCNCCSHGCIPPPTTTRTITMKKATPVFSLSQEF
jgi:hypothetical protein